MAKKKPAVKPDKDDLILAVLNQILDRLDNPPNKQEEISVEDEDGGEIEVTPRPPKKKAGRPPKVAPKTTSKSKSPSKNEPTKRRNLFEEMPEFHSFKSDKKIDAKLWKDREPCQRREASNRIELRCTGCNKKVKVLPEELRPDSNYQCNECIVSKKA